MYENSGKARLIRDNPFVHPVQSTSRVARDDGELTAEVRTSKKALWILSGESLPPMNSPTIEQVQTWTLRQLVLADQAEVRTMLAALLGLMQRRLETSVLPSTRGTELSRAERRVVAAVLAHPDLTDKALAAILCISKHTLRNQLASIYAKLGIHRRIELALLGFKPECGCEGCTAA